MKSLEDRALVNPLRIDVSAPGCFAVQALFVLVSSLAFLRMGKMGDWFGGSLFIALFWILWQWL